MYLNKIRLPVSAIIQAIVRRFRHSNEMQFANRVEVNWFSSGYRNSFTAATVCCSSKHVGVYVL